MSRLLAALVLLAALTGAQPAGRAVTLAAADPPAVYLVPHADGPAIQVTTELGSYVGFPSGVELPSGGYLLSYGVSDGHFDNTTTHRFRFSSDGVTWSGPWTPPVGADMGFTSLAAESAAQGGRVYALQVKVVLTSQTVTGVTPYIRWSEDDGRTWNAPAALSGGGVRSPAAAPQTWTFYPGSLIVRPDGSLLAAGYGGVNGHVLVRKSTDRGVTWTAAGDLAVAGRVLQEPQLCPLADGRIAMAMRSDSSTSSWLYLAVAAADGTWGAPRVITYDGSGAPACREIVPGWIAYQYRGWADRADPDLRPMRVGSMGVDPGTLGRGNIALDPNETGRFLYGVWFKRPDGGWLIVHGVEGPNGADAAAGGIWAQPVDFGQVPG